MKKTPIVLQLRCLPTLLECGSLSLVAGEAAVGVAVTVTVVAPVVVVEAR